MLGSQTVPREPERIPGCPGDLGEVRERRQLAVLAKSMGIEKPHKVAEGGAEKTKIKQEIRALKKKRSEAARKAWANVLAAAAAARDDPKAEANGAKATAGSASRTESRDPSTRIT